MYYTNPAPCFEIASFHINGCIRDYRTKRTCFEWYLPATRSIRMGHTDRSLRQRSGRFLFAAACITRWEWRKSVNRHNSWIWWEQVRKAQPYVLPNVSSDWYTKACFGAELRYTELGCNSTISGEWSCTLINGYQRLGMNVTNGAFCSSFIFKSKALSAVKHKNETQSMRSILFKDLENSVSG